MSITPEAVEAAANAISECSGMRFDGFWSRVEDLEPEDREYALLEARAALSAAAPYLIREAQAQAWEDAAEIFHHASSAALTLRARAAAIRDGAE
jgi:hypothetical protein